MTPAAVAPDEDLRLASLRSYEILDTPAEPTFDAITKMAAATLGVPIALITLIDRDRQWFKSAHGMAISQTPRDISLCAHVVAAGSPVIVVDALCDDRFRDNPLVTGPPHLRFYAGAPLRGRDGFVLGAFCVAGHAPRELTGAEREHLEVFADHVSAQLELGRTTRMLTQRRDALETHLRFFELSLDLFCTTDASLHFRALNPAWEQVLGWSLAELRARPFVEFVHPDDLARTHREAGRLLESAGPTLHFQNRYRHKDGHWVPLAWTAVSKHGLVYATARDMTLEHAKEAALRQSEAELSALFEGMIEGAVIQGPTGAILRANRAAESILGLTIDQLQGRTSVDPRWHAIHPDGSPFPGETHPAMVTLRTGEPQRDVMMGVLKPDGERTWISVNSQPVETPSGPRVLATFRDVTGRFERELAAEQAFLTTLLAEIPGAFIVVFDEGLRIERVFGAIEADLVGRPIARLASDPGQLEALARRCLAGEACATDVQREERRFEARFVPWARHAMVRGLGLFYDVTDRDTLLARRDRQERLATVGTLAAGVGHEINNPLASIVTNVELAHEELAKMTSEDPSTGELLDALADAKSSAQRIKTIVRGLQALARGEGAVAPTDVVAALDLAMSLSQHEVGRRATLVAELSPVPLVLADASRLAQVFVHLIVHAARSFTIADHDANRVVLRAKFDGVHVVVEVSSNSPPIPAEMARRVLDPFFSTSHVGGLGLSFSEQEIAALGGELTIDTTADLGTTFRVRLPAISRAE